MKAKVELELVSQSLHDIEGEVEDWIQKVLPDIEADLLSQAQSQYKLYIKFILFNSL